MVLGINKSSFPKEIPALKKQNQELQKHFERLVQDQQMANLEYDDRSGREMRDVRTQLNKLNNELFLIRSGAIGSHGTATALGAAADGHFHNYLHGYNFGAGGTVVGNSGNIRNGLQRIIEERNIQNDDWTSKRSILFTFLSYCVMPLMAILFVIMYPLTYIIDFLVTLFFLYKDPRVQKKGQHGKKSGGAAGQKGKGNIINNNAEDNKDQDKKGTVTIDNTNSKRAVPFLKREKADNNDPNRQQENDESEESKNQSALQNLAIWQKTQKQKL